MHITLGTVQNDWTQIVTAIAALTAAFLGPVSGYLAARNQAYRSVVSLNRQQWVDELRGEIAAYLAECVNISMEIEPDGMFRSDDYKSAAKASMNEINRLNAAIQLRLNPSEQDHQELIAALRLCIDVATSEGDFNAARDLAVAKAKKVLKKEWEVVKKGH